MIKLLILGRNRQINNEFIVVDPIAIIKDKKLISISDEEKPVYFPDSGKIHTPIAFQELTQGNYCVYELIESESYNYITNLNAHKYEVKERYLYHQLYEIVRIDYSYDYEKKQLIKAIREGFYKSWEPLSKIIIETNDKYIMGPFNVIYDFDEGLVRIENDFSAQKYNLNVYDARSNSLDSIETYDRDHNKTREFTLNPPNEDMFIGELDIASDEYILNEVLQLIKGQELYHDFDGVIDWLNEITLNEEVNLSRIEKAKKILLEVLPNQRYKDFKDDLFTIPTMKTLLEDKLEERFEQEYTIFLSLHEELKKSIDQMQEKSQILVKDIEEKEQELEEFLLFMEEQQKEAEHETLKLYFNKLLEKKIINKEKSSIKNKGYRIIKSSNKEVKTIENNREFERILKRNMGKYSLSTGFISQTISYIRNCINMNFPLIIVGPNSTIIANIIKNSLAAKNSIDIIYDDIHFNLYNLDIVKTSELSFTHLNNVHLLTSSFNIRHFLQTYRSRHHKFIFTIDSLNESEFLLEKLYDYPILNVDNISFNFEYYQNDIEDDKGQLKEINQLKVMYEADEDKVIDELILAFQEFGAANDIENLLKLKYKYLTLCYPYYSSADQLLEHYPFISRNIQRDLINNE